jgi:hypothetical protein
MTLGKLNPFGAPAPEGMDGSRTGNGLTLMPGPFWNKVLLSRSDWNALATDNQRIAALHNGKVFVVVMHVGSGYHRFATSPECHLTPIGSIKDVSFYPGSELTARSDLVCWMLHEIWKIIHGFSFKLGVIVLINMAAAAAPRPADSACTLMSCTPVSSISWQLLVPLCDTSSIY